MPLDPHSGFALDFDILAERFALTGGNIRNAVLAAAFAAAVRKNHPFVTTHDVPLGVRRGFQKLGRAMTPRELGLDPSTVCRPPCPSR